MCSQSSWRPGSGRLTRRRRSSAGHALVAHGLPRAPLGRDRPRGRRAAVRRAVARADHGPGRHGGGPGRDLSRVLHWQVGKGVGMGMGTGMHCESGERRVTRDSVRRGERGRARSRMAALEAGRQSPRAEGPTRAWSCLPPPARRPDVSVEGRGGGGGAEATHGEVSLVGLVGGLHGGRVGGPHAVQAVDGESGET